MILATMAAAPDQAKQMIETMQEQLLGDVPPHARDCERVGAGCRVSEDTRRRAAQLLDQWTNVANAAELADSQSFYVPTGEGLAYSLARQQMVKRYFPIADMAPGFDHYRLDIPPR